MAGRGCCLASFKGYAFGSPSLSRYQHPKPLSAAESPVSNLPKGPRPLHGELQGKNRHIFAIYYNVRAYIIYNIFIKRGIVCREDQARLCEFTVQEAAAAFPARKNGVASVICPVASGPSLLFRNRRKCCKRMASEGCFLMCINAKMSSLVVKKT